MLELVLSQIANGLVLGFLYVLIAIGLSIIFGMLGIVNFAHGAIFALGAYFAVTIVPVLGWWGLLLVPVATAALGVVFEITLIRRLYGKEPLFGLIVTFGLALLIEALIKFIWGPGGRPLSPPEFLQGFVEIGPVLLTKYRMAVIVCTIAILLALWYLLVRTPFGRIIRAGSEDREMVGLLGINVPRVFVGVVALSCCLAGTAGMLAAPLWTVAPSMAASAIMPAFVIVTIGGLGSYMGAIVAGLMVGIVTALTIQFWPAAAGASMYALMALVLLIRPRGLFGDR
ncbi:branched-chain amino acid ABC transporter permease [Paracoccus sp. (in: a-proteobacteria)]|uniref:branched-chain amino acid ABC transporter permease n=1 Tax=Paracoccus sp. TaxID=267 RepID=UPI00333FB25C